MKISVAQFPQSIDAARNRAEIAALVARAARDGAELVVFPEEAMIYATELHGRVREAAEEHWAPFEAHLTALAREHSIAIIAGGYEPTGRSHPHNTLLAVAADGSELDRYRKLHLYDAFAYRESGYVGHGEALPQLITMGDLTMGMLNCYDLRFPELARALVDAGATVLVVSAAWVRGARKEDHWTTLLRARAIENTCWVVAAGSTAPVCVGESMIIDPYGTVVLALGPELVSIGTHDVTSERVNTVRAIIPSLANRRLTVTTTIDKRD